MAHQGELTLIQTIDLMPLIIACDSTGEIILWALHPLPYKYCKILTYTNKDSDGNTSAVQGIAYLLSKHVLFIGDDRGNLQALSFKGVIEILNITTLSTNGRENKMMSLVNKSILAAPNIPIEIIEVLFAVKLHNECIRHVFLIRENEALITTSYDKMVKLVAAEDGRVLGSLQQGTATVKHKPNSRKEINSTLPWQFYLDIHKFIKRDEEEFQNIYQKIKINERQKKPLESLSYNEEARNFMNPQNPVKLSKDFDYDRANYQFSVTSPRVFGLSANKKDDLTKKYSVKNAQNGIVTFDLLMHKANKTEREQILNYQPSVKIDQIPVKSKRETQQGNINKLVKKQSRIPSLPSLSKIFRSEGGPNDIGVKKKLNTAALKSAADLADVLGESFF